MRAGVTTSAAALAPSVTVPPGAVGRGRRSDERSRKIVEHLACYIRGRICDTSLDLDNDCAISGDVVSGVDDGAEVKLDSLAADGDDGRAGRDARAGRDKVGGNRHEALRENVGDDEILRSFRQGRRQPVRHRFADREIGQRPVELTRNCLRERCFDDLLVECHSEHAGHDGSGLIRILPSGTLRRAAESQRGEVRNLLTRFDRIGHPHDIGQHDRRVALQQFRHVEPDVLPDEGCRANAR